MSLHETVGSDILLNPWTPPLHEEEHKILRKVGEIANRIAAADPYLKQSISSASNPFELLEAIEASISHCHEEYFKLSEQTIEAEKTKDRLLGILTEELRVPEAMVAKKAATTATISKLQHRNIEVSKLVDELAAKYRLAAGTRGTRLIVELMEGVPTQIFADEYKLRKLLNNLLSNAVKFTEKGEIEFSIKALKRNQTHCLLEFIVADTGIGIEECEIKQVFEPYWKKKNQSARSQKATGLGLSICRNLATLMGGSITVNSQKDLGSVFSFSCDLATSSTTSIPTNPKPSPTGNCHSAMVVDDNTINRKILGTLLEKLGYNVETVQNGYEAVEAATRADRAYDFICMDICMPGMDGIETAQKIRSSSSQNANTPIIAVTGFAQDGMFNKCRAAGMNDCVIKPVDSKRLHHSIDTLLKRKPFGV